MKEEKKTKEKKEANKTEKKEEKKRSPYLYALAVIVVVAIIVGALVLTSSAFSGVSFTSFKQNFLSSKSGVLVVYDYNNTVYNTLEVPCQNAILQLITSHQTHPVMSLYVIVNSSLCYYQDQLGTIISSNTVPTSTEAGCLSNASSYPSITLAYNQFNSTSITPYHMTVDGDAAYMRSCPIAVDFS